MTTKNKGPLCPKCKKNRLVKNGFRNGKQTWLCKTWEMGKTVYCYSTQHPDKPMRDQRGNTKVPVVRKPFKRKIDTGRMMVFTAAQNATPVHAGFHDALRTFCKHNDAELCVIPLRYKNPTSVYSDKQKNMDEVWAEEIRDVMYEQRKKLNSNLVAVGDVKIQPTTGDPLTSVDGFTHGESSIFGHTKMRLKCVATPQNRIPKVMVTTGAVTVPNYTDSKAGKLGEFHHVLGACIVEIVNDKKFHLHQINARKRDGAFIFKTTAYFADGTTEEQDSCKAMIFGDAHYRFADPQVVDATFGDGGLVDTLNPEVLGWHDLLDCYFGNPHHMKNPFIRKAKNKANFHVAQDEVFETIDWAVDLSAGRPAKVVASNHDDMFARWIIREDWKEIDPENQEFYLETALHMSRSARMSDTGAEYLDPFAFWINKLTKDVPTFTALERNEPWVVADNYLSFHGDKGPRGARGTVKNLAKIGVKLITGHGHTKEIFNGHYRTGTMTRLTAEYVDGPNDWTNTHGSIDNFGKRHLHTCIDGEFYR